MSARKKLNQSRPQALACDKARSSAGTGMDASVGATAFSAWRSSRPPSSSSASVDKPYASGTAGESRRRLSAGCPSHLGLPSLILLRPRMREPTGLVRTRTHMPKHGKFERNLYGASSRLDRGRVLTSEYPATGGSAAFGCAPSCIGTLTRPDDALGLTGVLQWLGPIIRLCPLSEECEMSKFSTLLIQLLLVSLLTRLRAESQPPLPMYN
jgi:hypothetical protein